MRVESKIKNELEQEWYRSWFNADYLKAYNHRNDDEARQFINRWNIWNQFASPINCLDLACGSGRYSRAIFQMGHKVIALDISRDLLQTAVDSSCEDSRSWECEGLRYVQGDMLNLPFREHFDMVISMFTSFGYFKDDSAHLQVLSEVSRVIVSDGLYVLDLPSYEATIKTVKQNPVTVRDFGSYKLFENRVYSEHTKRVEKRIVFEFENENREYLESVRLFRYSEIEKMINKVDLHLVELWGDYNGNSYNILSPRMILFCRKQVR